MFDFGGLTIAKSVPEAVRALAAQPDAVLIAGGSDVLIKIREGKLAGRALVSIHDIPELRFLRKTADGDLEIGPLCTFTELEESPLIRETVPVLGQAAGTVGGPQIRAMGTVGGNISNGVTSADTASTLMAYEAVLTITGPAGERCLPIRDYYTGAGKVALGPGELLTKITIPEASYKGFSGFYHKYGMRNAMEIATLGCSVSVKLSAAKDRVDDIRIGFGVASPVPMKAEKTEAALRGLPVREAAARIAGLVRQEIRPRDSWRASRAFRLHIGGEIAERAFREAVRMGGGAAE